MRDDNEFPEFQSGGDNLFAERRDVVLVSVPDFLDEAVGSQPLQDARCLPAIEVGQMAPEGFVPQTADIELAANDGSQQVFILLIEEVEPGVAATLQLHRLR